MRKLLFYSHDSYGLGNIRRMVAIAEYLAEHDPEVFILLITGSPMLHAFRTHPQIDFVKLPCLFRSQDGQYSARLRCFEPEPLLGLREALIKSVVESFEPDIFLVDKKPAGLGGELYAALAHIRETQSQVKSVLLLRDILDSPDVTRGIWQKNGYFDLIERHFHQVIVVGEKAVFDLPDEYGFPADIELKTVFCGYLERTGGRVNPARMHTDLAPHGEKVVVVAAGGGDDGRQVLATWLQGLYQVPWHDQIQTVMFYGPEMRETDYTELKAMASGLPKVRISEFSDDFMSYLSAADLVVSMGGYNTVCEILSLNKPAILIPRIKPVAEQLIRAQRLCQSGSMDYIHPAELTTDILMTKAEEQLFATGRAESPATVRPELAGMACLRKQLLK